jgi:ribosome biogenesis protein Tsr3
VHFLFSIFKNHLYFSSKRNNCENCTHKKSKKDGAITYSHTVLTPVIVSPNQNQVISLAPEFIKPQDGAEKQDCELNAAKRWLQRDIIATATKSYNSQIAIDRAYLKL